MPERKSGRARQNVNYAKYGAGDDSDDDFADSTPPVSKKQKLSSKENKSKKNEKPPQLNKESIKKSSRPSPEEKLYERELQAALELSLSQSEPSQESKVAKEISQNEAPILINEEDNRAPSPILPTIVNPPILTKVPHPTDDIQVLETGMDMIPSSRRRGTKPKIYVDSDDDEDADFLRTPLTPKVRSRKNGNDSDFAVEDDEDSLDEEDSDDDFNAGDSDSDFGGGKVVKNSGKKTSTPKPKKTTIVTKSVKKTSVSQTKTTPVARKPMLPKPSQSAGVKTTKSPTLASLAGRTSTSSLPARKTPTWTAPGPSTAGTSPLGGVSLKSPSTGIRIGLSRNIRLKSLHPNIKIHN